MAELHTGTLGWVYIALTSAWTVILLGAMAFLYHHRQLPFIRIRRLPLVFTAIVLLHMYEAAAMAAWTYGPLMPCDVQFWIMSIYLPFGMAMLQASNSQFLHVAAKQRQYTKYHGPNGQKFPNKVKEADPSWSWWKKLIWSARNADKVTQILILIGIAMVVELALTFFIYFGSDVFHPSYGIFHAEIPATEERIVVCLEGWEWWLSILWQFFWAWVYAPFMLWKTRNIHDTNGWRTQTILCCISGLPASPLWLAGLYIPQMGPVNEIVLPPQWFAVSIFFIEVFTILLPCWQVVKTHSLKRETVDALASWEERNKALSSWEVRHKTSNESIDTPASSKRTSTDKTRGTVSTSGSQFFNGSLGSRQSDMFTMIALQSALESNPTPLLEFAALKDFSGENVSFLLEVSHWKRTWTTAKGEPQLVSQQFTRAVQIYSHFISLKHSEFPINICSRHAKDMFQMFDSSVQILNKRERGSNQVAPFGTDPLSASTSTLTQNSENDHDLEKTLGMANLQSALHMVELAEQDNLTCPIPSTFGPEIFDATEEEIMYLVLTNTWPKFVHAGLKNASQENLIGSNQSFAIGKLFCGWGDNS